MSENNDRALPQFVGSGKSCVSSVLPRWSGLDSCTKRGASGTREERLFKSVLCGGRTRGLGKKCTVDGDISLRAQQVRILTHTVGSAVP